MADMVIREAREDDLDGAYDVFYENEVAGNPDPPPRGETAPWLRHVWRTGSVYVAEEEGRITGYAGAITRGPVTYLTDLFVRPAVQSAHLGTRLLQRALPPSAGGIRCTMASTDPRAASLYIRNGMIPQWPHYCLRANRPAPEPLAVSGIETIEAEPQDAEMIRWDAEVGGRPRPQEHAFWVREERGIPLWFRRRGTVIGYGYVRLGAGSLWYPDAAAIGPVGVRDPDDAVACVAAAIAWARDRAEVLRISVPGSHPALTPLLDTHFLITYVETFLSSAPQPFFDLRCYLSSESNLL